MLTDVKLLAVDLDGTLVDSAPDLAHCVDDALGAVSLPPAGEALTRSWVGDGIENLLARALQHALQATPDSDLLARALRAFDICYERNLFERSRVYPGVAETLDALLERGLRLCCVTNKRVGFAAELLRQASLLARFDFVLGGDSLPRKKPHPDQLLAASQRSGIAAANAALVGDSEHDYGAARQAGFAFIWASYGYRANIEAVDGHDLTSIEGFADIENLLLRQAG